MRITAELSLYPLESDFVPKILAFIGALRAGSNLEMRSNQMSTQIRGELDDVMRALHGALETSFEAGGSQVLVAKFLNADLPIGEAPDLGAHD
jgi:uncharacterized protein YqgV (UPF0045/DUF77 family)